MGEIGFNPQQQSAIDSHERTILCLAAAGCGKTHTLLARIERLIQDGADPKSILALTFTNAAAFEMKERYERSPRVDLSRGLPEFRTFHSFCYSLIVKDPAVRERIGYCKIPELCDDADIKRIRTKVKLQIGCDLSDEYLEKDVPLSKKDMAMKKLFHKAFIKEIKNENVITFDIMCYNVCELFKKKEECIEKYRKKYYYIFLDEMQDTDPRQFYFVSSFPETTSFFMVGDCLQAIYGFRGCSNEFIKQLSVAPGWEVIRLYKNYRSTRQICDFANKFSTYAKSDYRIEMEGQRDGDPVEVVYGSNASYDQPVDKQHLKELIARIKKNKTETAVLCRTNKECACVRAALSAEGIESNSGHKESDKVNILNASLDNQYLVGWLASLLEAKEYANYIRLSSITSNPDLRWFYGLYGDVPKVKTAGNKVKKIRTIASGPGTIQEKIEGISKALKIKTTFSVDEGVVISNRELVEHIRDQLIEEAENRVYVGTIHSAKGLEYNAVYVMGVNDKMFRLGEEEMNNLYYVAITRAKNYLTVFRR